MYHDGGARIPLALNVAKQITTAQWIRTVDLRIVTLTILRRLTQFAAHVKDEVTNLRRFRSA